MIMSLKQKKRKLIWTKDKIEPQHIYTELSCSSCNLLMVACYIWNKCTNDYTLTHGSIIIINNNNKCDQKLLSQYKRELSVSDIKKKQFKLE